MIIIIIKKIKIDRVNSRLDYTIKAESSWHHKEGLGRKVRVPKGRHQKPGEHA